MGSEDQTRPRGSSIAIAWGDRGDLQPKRTAPAWPTPERVSLQRGGELQRRRGSGAVRLVHVSVGSKLARSQSDLQGFTLGIWVLEFLL